MRGVFWIALALVSLIASSAHAADLKVTLRDVRSDDGAVMIGLYDDPVGFVAAIKDSTKNARLNEPTRRVGVSMRATAGFQSIVFTDLPPGRYAIIAFHDENDNGRLDENALGLPTEGYGFSNDARGLLSAPSFDAAAITMGAADMSIAISLAYPRMYTLQDRRDLDEFLGR
jgi:uncharacterized protein (DUF2141 family)